MEQLIVGTRDLKPRLAKLDEKAEVIVAFDACFSGESAKSISSGWSRRYSSLAELTRGDVSSERIQAAERALSSKAIQTLPYRHAIYFAAASNRQYALDISRRTLQEFGDKLTTFDHEPHGVFTDAFLKLIADGSGGKAMSCQSLFQRTFANVQETNRILEFKQDPQLLVSAEMGDRMEKPCFEELGPAPHPIPDANIKEELDSIVKQATFSVTCRTDQPNYKDGQKSVLHCQAPDQGFFAVLSWGEGDQKAIVILPNQYQTLKQVTAGDSQIPSDHSFTIENYIPEGKSQQHQMMVVLFSRDRESLQPLTKIGDPAGIFRAIPLSSLHSFRSQRPVGATGYGVAKIEFELSK